MLINRESDLISISELSQQGLKKCNFFSRKGTLQSEDLFGKNSVSHAKIKLIKFYNLDTFMCRYYELR